MKYLLSILLFFFLLSKVLLGQSERSETIVIPVSSLGEVSEVRKQILQNTLEDELKSHFRLISQERFEEVQEKVFEELEYDECTEEQCIVMIQEMLQVENVFHLQVLGEGQDTQLSLSWRTLDEKRKETDYCEGCKTKELNEKVGGLFEKLVGKSVVEKQVVVEKSKSGILYRDLSGKKWFSSGDERSQLKYEGQVKDGVPHGKGIMTGPNKSKYVGEFNKGRMYGPGTINSFNGEKMVGEFREDKPWNTIGYDKNGNIIGKFVNGVKQ